MAQKSSRPKRELQYEHITHSLFEGDKLETLAQEIAARVIKERALHGESVTFSSSSVNDMPPVERSEHLTPTNSKKDTSLWPIKLSIPIPANCSR